MAKITIAGDAVIVTSALTLEDIRKIEKYRPKALVLTEGDENEPVFAIGTTEGAGNINSVGVSFGRETRDGRGFATVTMCIAPEEGEDVVEFVADKIGGAIMNLNKLEATLPQVLTEINLERAEIMRNITVM